MIKNNQTYQMRMCFNVKKSKEFHELWRISTDFFSKGSFKKWEKKGKKLQIESRGVTFGPEPGNTIVLFSILQVLCGDTADKWIGGVAIRQ